MSERVERKILAMLPDHALSPYGNPIPGLAELGETGPFEQFRDGVAPLTEIVTEEPALLIVRRIGEPAQADQGTLEVLTASGIRPGATVRAHLEDDRVLARVENGPEGVSLPREIASHVFVQLPS